jgi:hypothetical protein
MLSPRSSLLVVALVLLAFTGSTIASAQSAGSLDKHGRKIQHKLAKYQQGSYLRLVVNGTGNEYGALGKLSETTFTFTNSDSNATATYRYNDVSRVLNEQEPIGHGTEPHHIRHLVPIVITAAAIGAGALTYTMVR